MREIDDFRSIYDRMILATKSCSAADFAKKMGKTKQAINQALTKGKIPDSWSIEVACLTGCSIDWLVFGKTEYQKKVDALFDMSEKSAKMASELKDYFNSSKDKKS